MKPWIESSLVVRGVRLVVHASITAACRLVSDRPVLPGAFWASSRWGALTSTPGGGSVAKLADDSRIIHAFERSFEMAAKAWRESGTQRRLIGIVNPAPNLNVQRVRLTGWIAFVAAVTHILLVGVDALLEPSASGLGWVAAIPLALACMIKPEAVVAAWESSRYRRG